MAEIALTVICIFAMADDVLALAETALQDEDSVVKVMQEVWGNPQALAAVEVAYDVNLAELVQDAASLRKELARLDKTLDELK